MEYEWPFPMPGATGIRQAGYGTPEDATIEALVRHAQALCGFNEALYSSDTHSKNSIEALAVLTATGYGFANGYMQEVHTRNH